MFRFLSFFFDYYILDDMVVFALMCLRWWRMHFFTKNSMFEPSNF